MGILLLSSEFAIQVPGTAGDLFLCPSSDASCPSNLLAGTSLKAGKGVAVEGGGLQRVRRGVGSNLAPRGFSISLIWAGLQAGMSVPWECHSPGIVDHMVVLGQTASRGE